MGKLKKRLRKNTYEIKNAVLITGCSSGFGKASAALFLDHGWNVIATMRSPKARLFEDGDRLLVTSLDVTNPNSISDAISKGIEQFGDIDVVVNNAGIGSLMLTELRQTLPEPDFIARMRSMFGGGPKK